MQRRSTNIGDKRYRETAVQPGICWYVYICWYVVYIAVFSKAYFLFHINSLGCGVAPCFQSSGALS